MAIHLDQSICTWVLLPVVGLTLLATLVRQALAELSMGAMPVPGGPMPGQKLDVVQLQTTNTAAASKLTRAAAFVLSPAALAARRRYYVGPNEDGRLCETIEQSQPQNPLQSMLANDPSAMAKSMKYQMPMLILNGGLAFLISYLFADSIAAKTPFPLTRAFKGVLQRGIDVDSLDPSYVSALSLYFLVVFCSGSYSFLLNRATGLLKSNPVSALEAVDPMMGALMAGGGGGMGGPTFQLEKLFGQEADGWRMLPTVDFLPNVEDAALKMMRKARE